jgi:circadian clock protein KaiC
MNVQSVLPTGGISKAPTGIAGVDEATRGGIPRGRTTLIEGGPGAGKTVMALQALVHGARALGEPGIFVAFEESAERIVANASQFGWDLPALQADGLFILNAQPQIDTLHSGGTDLTGLLSALDAKIAEIGARRIAFDAIDVLMHLLDDDAAERREIYRLHEWLLARGLTAMLTCKAGAAGSGRRSAGFMQFMVDCALVLDHRLVQGVSQRGMSVLKYRGSGFHENETPFVIGAQGLDVAGVPSMTPARPRVSQERVSSGLSRLDAMLGGGYFRGASVLVTGVPGTAKTTLCGAFAEAACRRGEPTLYVSFDTDAAEMVRNLGSVGIRLDHHLGDEQQAGPLRIVYARAVVGSAESHLLYITQLARAHGARCLVIDPVSALAKTGNTVTGIGVAQRLLDWAKATGITLLCSSLLDDVSPNVGHTDMEISTLADTWIHLRYIVQGGERNRGLAIMKSRGTEHSNQVRELLLNSHGITLADAYGSGGEVLMGTLRWEREQFDQAAQREADAAERKVHIQLMSEEAELTSRLAGLQRELDGKRADLNASVLNATARRNAASTQLSDRMVRRGADTEPASLA